MGAIGLVNPSLQFFTDAGAPLVAGLVYTYVTGTSTPTPTYTDSGLSVANANPIVLDGGGRCVMFLPATPAVKIVVKTSGGSTVYTQDTITQAVVVT